MTGLLSKLVSSNRMLREMRCDSGESASAVQEERAWQSTQHKFVEMLERAYPCFVDLLGPFVVAVYQVAFGMRVVAHGVQSALRKHQVVGVVVCFCE